MTNLELFDPISFLIEETESMILAVSHQNVADIINHNSRRVTEHPLTISGAAEPPDAANVPTGGHDEDLIQAEVGDEQFSAGESEEPAFGLGIYSSNDICQEDLDEDSVAVEEINLLYDSVLRSAVNKPETLVFVLGHSVGLPALGVPPGSGDKDTLPVEHLDSRHVLGDKEFI